MGEEYPGVFVTGEETAPKSAAEHSERRVESVVGGRATPVCWKWV